jgi:hypothetical protein
MLATDRRRVALPVESGLAPGQLQPLTSVRPLRVADRDRYKSHPDAGPLRLVCGGHVCLGEPWTVGILAKHNTHEEVKYRGSAAGNVGLDRVLSPKQSQHEAPTCQSGLVLNQPSKGEIWLRGTQPSGFGVRLGGSLTRSVG